MLAGVFVLLVGPPKSDRLKDRGQISSTGSIFLPFTFLLDEKSTEIVEIKSRIIGK